MRKTPWNSGVGSGGGGGNILAAVQWVSLLRRSLVLCLVWEHCTLSAYVSTFSFLDSFLFPLCLCVFIASSSSWKHQEGFAQIAPVIAGNCVCLESCLWEIPLFPLRAALLFPQNCSPSQWWSLSVSHRSPIAALAWDHTKLPVKYRQQEITL